MNTREAIAARIKELCQARGITPNGLSDIAAVPQATIKSILNGESQNPGTVTIKKLCDGFSPEVEVLFDAFSFKKKHQNRTANVRPLHNGGRTFRLAVLDKACENLVYLGRQVR